MAAFSLIFSINLVAGGELKDFSLPGAGCRGGGASGGA